MRKKTILLLFLLLGGGLVMATLQRVIGFPHCISTTGYAGDFIVTMFLLGFMAWGLVIGLVIAE